MMTKQTKTLYRQLKKLEQYHKDMAIKSLVIDNNETRYNEHHRQAQLYEGVAYQIKMRKDLETW